MENNNLVNIVPFVLQRHEALSAGLHYDLRIMYPFGKKLASWALPKARIPKNTKERFLVIKTMDHDYAWLTFQGYIPEGKYGHGKVTIIDKGNAKIYKWSDYLITFEIKGKFLNGKYTLIRTTNSKANLINRKLRQEAWWFIKNKEN